MDLYILDRLPIDWAAWTLENVIRGVSTRDIQKTLAEAGYVDVAKEFDSATGFDSSAASRRAVRSLTTYREILLRRLKLRTGQKGAIKRRKFDAASFYDDFYFANEPLILENLREVIPSFPTWTPDLLKEKFGDTLVEVQLERDKDTNYELNLDSHRARMSLGSFIDLIQSTTSSNDIYMCANNRTLDTDLLQLFKEIPHFPGLLDSNTAQGQCFLWLGPGGTITPFHYDLMNVLLCQVYGEKTFVIAPPEATPFMYNEVGVFSKVDCFGDHSNFPLFKHVPLTVDVIRPGEALFIPVGWWHAIRANSQSISLSFTNFLHGNEYRRVS